MYKDLLKCFNESSDDTNIATEPGNYRSFYGEIKTEFVEGKVENATFEIKENGEVIWENGTWEDGYWAGGKWRGGVWHGGTWHGGTWYGGTWEKGIWYNGTWENGTWYNGAWERGRDKSGKARTDSPDTWCLR